MTLGQKKLTSTKLHQQTRNLILVHSHMKFQNIPLLYCNILHYIHLSENGMPHFVECTFPIKKKKRGICSKLLSLNSTKFELNSFTFLTSVYIVNIQ